MTAIQKTIVILSCFSLGIMQPILSLLLLNRGATLATLSIAMGIYAATVFAFELPSGIFADLHGRKNSFLLSIAAGITGMIILLFTRGLFAICIVMLLQGLGRSFASGSLDALIIDDCLERHGSGYTSKVTSQIAICQSIGLAAGALAGGVIPSFGGYVWHISLRTGTLALAGLLFLFLTREVKKPAETRPRLKEHVSGCVKVIKVTALIKYLLIGIFLTGCILAAVETYWQPAFTAVAGGSLRPLLGVICFAGFGAATLGNFIMQKLNSGPKGMSIMYFTFKGLLGLSVILFAVQKSVPGFILCYSLIYLVLGLAEIAESTLINNHIPSESRASLLSLLSLTLQAGTFTACGFAGLFLGFIGFKGIWIVFGAMAAVVFGLCALLYRRGHTKLPVAAT